MSRFVEPRVQESDASGDVLAGSKLSFFVSGTSTAKSVFTDAALSIPHTQPIIADAAGRFSDIYLDGSAHRAILQDSNDVQIWVVDDIYGIPTEDELKANFQTNIESFTATASQTLFSFSSITYTLGSNQLLVYINGVLQVPGVNFTETSTSSFTLTSGADANDIVVGVVGVPTSTSLSSFDRLSINEGPVLTISSGAITVTHSFHPVDTEGLAASDDLTTINGLTADRLLILRANDSARTVVVRNASDNIQCGSDFSLDHVNDRITLIGDGTNAVQLSRSDNA